MSVPVVVVTPTAIPPGLLDARLVGLEADRIELSLSDGSSLHVDQRVIIDGAPAFRVRGRVLAVEGPRVVVGDVRFSVGDARASSRFEVHLGVAHRPAGPGPGGVPAWHEPPAAPVDLSATGMRFRDRAGACAVGDRLEVRLGVPGTATSWQLVADVVRVDPDGDGCRVAVAFVDVPVEAVALMASTLVAGA